MILNIDKTQRRFIAAAVCPNCGLSDKIFVNLSDDAIACVSCDFYEQRPTDQENINPGVIEIGKHKLSNVQSAPDLVRLIDD